jgi:hypothetical protein
LTKRFRFNIVKLIKAFVVFEQGRIMMKAKSKPLIMWVSAIFVSLLLAASGRLQPEMQDALKYGPVRGGGAQAPTKWYFAEGSTRTGKECFFDLFNPETYPATIFLKLFSADGSKVEGKLDIPGGEKVTVDCSDYIPAGDSAANDFSTILESVNGVGIIAERSMYWNSRNGGHNTIGATAPNTIWYFAEGSTEAGYETFLTILNPNDTDASADLTYYFSDGTTVSDKIQVGLRSRSTIDVGGSITKNSAFSAKVVSDQPVVAERSMYWDGMAGGVCTIGSNAECRDWTFAEGSTQNGFEAFLCVQNPGISASNLDLTLIFSDGSTATHSVSAPANSRSSFCLSDYAAAADFGVDVQSDGFVVVERSMYWNSRNFSNLTWYFSGGKTSGDFTTEILLLNSRAATANVEITYFLKNSRIKRTETIPPHTKRKVDVKSSIGAHDFGTKIVSDSPIYAEQAVYWGNPVKDGSITPPHLGFRFRFADLVGSWAGQGTYCRHSDDGSWNRMGGEADCLCSGDYDQDGFDDLIGSYSAQGGVWTKKSATGTWDHLASSADCITVGDMNGDGKYDLVGSWAGQGVFYRNAVGGGWTKIATPAQLLATGDVDCDGFDDIIGVWPGQNGVWIKKSGTNTWERLASSADSIAAGDMNGDGRCNLVGSWAGQGVFLLDETGIIPWVKIASPAQKICAGDMDGDGIGDLIGLWADQGGIWLKKSNNGQWERLSSSADAFCTGMVKPQSDGFSSPSLVLSRTGLLSGFAAEFGPQGVEPDNDFSAHGPGGALFMFQEEKNLIPVEEKNGQPGRLPGPEEPGFRFVDSGNNFPKIRQSPQKR